MSSKSSFYWYLDGKDNVSDSSNNDYQAQRPNFIFPSPLIYKNQNENNIIPEQMPS